MENKLIVTKKILSEETSEISLPYYSKLGNSYYKIISNKLVVSVWVGDPHSCIATYSVDSTIREAASYPEIQEQEFNGAFQTALYNISKNVDLWVSVGGQQNNNQETEATTG